MRSLTWKQTGAVLLVLALLLAGCGQAAPEAPAPPAPPADSGQGAETPPPAPPARPVTEYTIPATSDYSGPYADLFPMIDAGRNACLDWWNDTAGAEAGVRLKLETFDSRYDPAIISSTYPRMVSQHHPIAWLGWGGSDVQALVQRLPDDQIPLLMSVAAYGTIWHPNTWVVTLRPTAVHEFVAFQDWMLTQWHEDRPFNLGTLAFESPVVADAANGLTASFAALFPGRAAFGPTEYADPVPVDVSSQARRLVDGGADAVMISTTTAQAAALLNGMEQIGAARPLVLSSHNGLEAVANILGGNGLLEGSFEAYALRPAYVQDIPAVTVAWEKYGNGKPWDMDAVQGCGQTLLLGAAVRRAAEANGPEALTGAQVYAAFADTTITADEMLGLTPDLVYTHERPFPLSGLWVSTITDGVYGPAVDNWWPVPDLSKW